MNVFQLFSIILALAGMAGGAAGWFAKSRGETLSELREKEAEYWKDKATQLEKDMAATVADCDSYKKENKRLMNLAKGNPHLAKLAREVNIQNEAIKELTKLMKGNNNGKS